jgi:uncharacterized protein YjbI with pentapeptide repeats
VLGRWRLASARLVGADLARTQLDWMKLAGASLVGASSHSGR